MLPQQQQSNQIKSCDSSGGKTNMRTCRYILFDLYGGYKIQKFHFKNSTLLNSMEKEIWPQQAHITTLQQFVKLSSCFPFKMQHI